MGRTRSIDRDAVLDAAERVVARVGAANLTLDAVAREAGISKGSVLYDAKTKQAVLDAVVERAFRRDADHHAAAENTIGDSASLAIEGRLRVAAEPPSESFLPVATNLTAALALDEGLRAQMRNQQRAVIERVLATSAHSRGALLAYLALEGLKFLEHLDFHHFPPADRKRIITEIGWLANAEPQPRSNDAAVG